jgi:amidase
VTAPPDDAIGSSDLVDLRRRVSQGEVAAAEVRAATRQRVDAAEYLNALTAWVPEPEDHVPPAGSTRPLAGLPILIKDNDDIAGMPTTFGSMAVPDRPAPRHSPPVQALLDLGLTPLAKTTMPEFGLTATTESTRFGATRNPWDPSRSVGGSSGGSAALVAAGAVAVAHANDGGGSIRIPAAACGLVGLKPTRGRVPDRPEARAAPVPITAQGVLTTTVRDTALVLCQLDRTAPARGLPPLTDDAGPTSPLRIRVVTEHPLGIPVDAEVVAATTQVAQVLAEMGHHVESAPAPVGARFALDFLHYWSLLSLLTMAALRSGRVLLGSGFRPERAETITRGLADRCIRQRRHIPAAIRRLRRMATEPDPSLTGVDVLLTPVLGHQPPPIGDLGPTVDYHTHLRRLLPYTAFTPLQNVTGVPAIALPLGRDTSGAPIGVQLVANTGQEGLLLGLAASLEEAMPWPRHAPPR